MSAFDPAHILEGDDGRWYHDGVDVTDRLIWWRCIEGHSWQASLAIRTGPDDPGCPTCAVNRALGAHGKDA